MEKRRMCPNCRAFISTDDKICPYCEVKVGPKAVDRRPSTDDGGWLSHTRFTTTVILLINLGLYAATAIQTVRAGQGSFMDIDGQTLYNFGAKYSLAVLAGDWWRLVTAGFLHGGLFHIFMNSWALIDLGARVEEAYGTARYLVFYFCSTVAGFLASTFWSASLSIGASAGVFGLIGVMIALGSTTRSPYAQALRGHYISWAIYGLVIGLLPGFHVDNAAHIGGLVAGMAVAYVAGTPRLLEDWREKIWKIGAGVSVAITAASFGWMFLHMTA